MAQDSNNNNNNESTVNEIEGLLLELQAEETAKNSDDCDSDQKYDHQSVLIQIPEETEINQDCSKLCDNVDNTKFNQRLEECKGIIESIIEEVFNIIEDKAKTTNVVNKNINILSNIIIKKGEKREISEDIWKTHLHWPTPVGETTRKCRNNV